MTALITLRTMIADATGFGHMDGFGWGMMGMGWLVILIIGGLVVWAVVYTSSRPSAGSEASTASAERILADRLARGEIDIDEYRGRFDELRR